MKKFLLPAQIILLVFSAKVCAGTLVEDFTTLSHADLANSTGVWDTVTPQARAQAFANAAVDAAARPIDFGNGSDGVVNSSTGFTFNTDTHPNGYQFQSLTITGGTITVVGSHPLAIRSLSNITISPALQVNGPDGGAGSLNGLTVAGQNVATCLAKGGDGGSATISTAANGGDAVFSGGGTDPVTHGIGQIAGVYNSAIESNISGTSGSAGFDFDTSPALDFICGTSGAGGGGYTTNGGAFGSGGAGGAGGGVMKLIAIGDINVGITEAKGGNGGNGVTVGAGPVCSGTGTAGYGGVIFFQTLANLITGVDPNVNGGTSGTSACFVLGNGTVVAGLDRGDTNSTGARPAWTGGAVAFDTDIVPANLQSFVQSTAYDLRVLNANFTTDNTTSAGTVTMTYAGSIDGVNFSSFTNLTSLNNKGYRFIKFRATFTNPGAAGVAPKVTQVSIPYTDAGLANLDMKLSAGCGTLALVGGKSNRKSDETGFTLTLFWILLAYGSVRFQRRFN